MYNSSIKNNFIRNIFKGQPVQRRRARRVFDWVEEYEESWHCDLCMQKDEAELQKIVDWLMLESVPRHGVDLLIILRDYARWCDAQEIVGSTTKLLDVFSQDIREIQSNSVSGPEQLQNFLNSIYRPEIDHTIDNTYRCFYWLAFGGIAEEESYNITSDDVDIKNKMIQFDGRFYPIYNEGVKAIQSCTEDKSFIYRNDNYKNAEISRERVSGNELLRGIRMQSDMENSHMRIKISKKQKEAKDDNKITLSLSYLKVWRSGVFYRELINEKDPSDNTQAFFDVSNVMLQVGSRSYNNDVASIEEKQKRIVRELDRLYKRWKIAHGYA